MIGLAVPARPSTPCGWLRSAGIRRSAALHRPAKIPYARAGEGMSGAGPSPAPLMCRTWAGSRPARAERAIGLHNDQRAGVRMRHDE